MGACEQAVMDFESQSVSARVTKNVVTVFSKTCNKYFIIHMTSLLEVI